jgi:hypothetical protein
VHCANTGRVVVVASHIYRPPPPLSTPLALSLTLSTSRPLDFSLSLLSFLLSLHVHLHSLGERNSRLDDGCCTKRVV